jgi:hypothetical protein
MSIDPWGKKFKLRLVGAAIKTPVPQQVKIACSGRGFIGYWHSASTLGDPHRFERNHT